MNRLLIPLALLLAGGSAFAGETTEREQAIETVSAFAKALKGELVAAMQSGGPLAAIEVCNVKAPGIADTMSLDHGMQISRVSLKSRNPENIPNDWQEQVLLDWEERVESGEDAGGLAWQKTVQTENGGEYRFMKAIPTDSVCLACHGTNIEPAVQNKLAELYPQDRATGYRQGDMRGAFVVTKVIDE